MVYFFYFFLVLFVNIVYREIRIKSIIKLNYSLKILKEKGNILNFDMKGSSATRFMLEPIEKFSNWTFIKIKVCSWKLERSFIDFSSFFSLFYCIGIEVLDGKKERIYKSRNLRGREVQRREGVKGKIDR